MNQNLKRYALPTLIGFDSLDNNPPTVEKFWCEHEYHGHHLGRNYGAVERDYYYERAPRYAPPPPPRYNSYDQRSHQGLAGGVIGSVFGLRTGCR